MNGVDIGLFQFDWDLTWQCFLMNSHGLIYGRYGARKSEKADACLSKKGLLSVMQKALDQHKTDADKKGKWTPRFPEQIKSLPDNLRNGKECIHCHQVGQFDRRDKGGGSPKEILEQYPLPDNIGLVMSSDKPDVIEKVDPASPAGKAGIKDGDRIVSINGTKVSSSGDISYILNFLPKNPTVKIEIVRGATTGSTVVETEMVQMTLTGDWRQRDISWRASMWALRPIPGFGGPSLSAEEKTHAALDPEKFAMRVNYIVDWGQDANIGNAVKKAGLQRGDIVISVAGKNDFESELAMQTWFRLNIKPGGAAELIVVRNGKQITIRIPVMP